MDLRLRKPRPTRYGSRGDDPPVFSRLHRKYRTPHIGILAVLAVCLISPWLGRAAMMRVVDMSSIGVTIAYLYTCLCAFHIFRPTHEAHDPEALPGMYSTTKKVLSGVGAAIAVIFMLLLLIPGSPGALGPRQLAFRSVPESDATENCVRTEIVAIHRRDWK